MALFDGGLGGLLGGGSADPYDLYGDILSEKQRAALRARSSDQTWANAANFLAKAAMPTNKKIPLGGLLAGLAGAMGGSNQDEAALTALKGGEITAKIAKLRREQRLLDELDPIQKEFLRRRMAQYASGDGVPSPAGAPTAEAPAAAAGRPGGYPPPPPAAAPNVYPTVPPGVAFEPGPQPPGVFPPVPGPSMGAPGAETLPDLAGLLSLPQYASQQQDTGRGLLAGMLPFLDGATPGLPDVGPVRVEALSGEAAPILSDETLRRTAPVAALGGPPKPANAWDLGTTYDQPKVPYGAGPEAMVKPSSNLTGSAWEIANNNFGGLRRPGVNATPSRGGFQSFSTPEAGVGAIAHQLDRYASGATTGKPLSTIREIVSTWAPPNENDTEALIRRATRIMGVGDNIPLNIGDPAVKAKLIEATIRNEQGGKLPVDPGLIAQAANAAPGTYTPSSLPNVGGVRIEPLGGAAAPAGGGGLIPGLGVAPEELAILNSMYEAAGVDAPFKSLLDTYYKSPGYLREKARTEAEANKGVALKYDPLIEEQNTRARLRVETELKPALEAAVEKAKNGPLQEREQAVADIARITKQFEQAGAAALNPTKATVVGQDGQIITQDITALELAKRQQARAERAAKGDTRILPGDVVGAPTGNLPPGYQHRITPEGVITAGPVANTPAAREEAEAVEKKRLEAAQKQTATDFVVTDIDRIREKVKASPFTTTGVVGGWLSGINQTDAGFIKNAVEGIEANILLDRMLALKAASPTGASGLGSLTEQEGQRLVKAYGSLKNSQDTADFLYNLDRVQRLYLELVHGPVAAQQMMANRPEVAGPGAARPAASPAASPALTQQMRTEAMQAIGKGAPRDKVLQRLREMGVDTGGL